MSRILWEPVNSVVRVTMPSMTVSQALRDRYLPSVESGSCQCNGCSSKRLGTADITALYELQAELPDDESKAEIQEIIEAVLKHSAVDIWSSSKIQF